MKVWKIHDVKKTDSIDIYIVNDLVAFESLEIVSSDIKPYLEKLVQTREKITGEDLRNYFGYIFAAEPKNVIEVFEEVLEVLKNK